jgi:hypothetical protein
VVCLSVSTLKLQRTLKPFNEDWQEFIRTVKEFTLFLRFYDDSNFWQFVFPLRFDPSFWFLLGEIVAGEVRPLLPFLSEIFLLDHAILHPLSDSPPFTISGIDRKCTAV